jgi:phospholipid-binding lipoprotein MlaA
MVNRMTSLDAFFGARAYALRGAVWSGSMATRRAIKLGMVAWLSILLTACATVDQPDPLEPMNRKVASFNAAADLAVFKPLSQGYVAVVPSPVRAGVNNFFNHLKDAWSAINLMLQGRGDQAARQITRLGVNTLFGMGGAWDIATEMGIDRYGADLGQTLGRWGVPQGAYVVLPFLGATTARDWIDLPGQQFFRPQAFVDHILTRNAMSGLQLIDARAAIDSVAQTVSDISLDNYLFIRDSYLQRRQSLIEDMDDPYPTSSSLPPDWEVWAWDGKAAWIDGGSEAAQAQSTSGPQPGMAASSRMAIVARHRLDGLQAARAAQFMQDTAPVWSPAVAADTTQVSISDAVPQAVTQPAVVRPAAIEASHEVIDIDG